MNLNQLIDETDRWRLSQAAQMVRHAPQIADPDLNRALQRSLQDAVFLQICSQRRLGCGPAFLREIDEPHELTNIPAHAEATSVPLPQDLHHLPDDLFGQLHERALARPVHRDGRRLATVSGRRARRGQGVFYTPSFIVDYIVRDTLQPLFETKTGDPPAIVDPACGAGAFLLGAFDYIAQSGDPGGHRVVREGESPAIREGEAPADREGEAPAEPPSQRLVRSLALPVRRTDLDVTSRIELVRRHLFGVDQDPLAVRGARLSLALKMLGPGTTPSSPPTQIAQILKQNVRCGDSLLDVASTDPSGLPHALDWHRAFPEVFHRRPCGFDAVIGNPPYVNIRRVTQELGELAKRYFRGRFQCARGAFDLFVLFIERAYELLRDGGRFGMIIPNKLATLGYAQACRRLLLSGTTIEQIVDVADLPIFRGAGVYPCILGWRKEPPAEEHRIRVAEPLPGHAELAGPLRRRSVKQASLSARRGFTLTDDLDLESRVPTAPLGDLAELHSGATGFSAAEIAAALVDTDEPTAGHFEFIVSGNIDRYQVTPGNVRFMKQRFRRPQLPLDASCLSPRKRTLYAEPKLVIAGMTRRLEAAYDAGGTALGVQVYAVRQPQLDPMYLLALLNSRLLSHLFRQRFAAKRLAGGYLAINKGQLAQLPIRQVDFSSECEKQAHDELARLAQRLTRLHQLPQANDPNMEEARLAEIDRIDGQSDAAVEGLYEVQAKEMAA